MSLSALQQLKERLPLSARMPLVFLGHGSPMNIIEDNDYRTMWSELGQTLPKPKAILVVSAHWMTSGSTLVDVSEKPRTIHDFYGFPEALYQHQYPAQGEPKLAGEVASMLGDFHTHTDDAWGLDHGAWALLQSMYPNADVPVFQLSVDVTRDMQWHLAMGKVLSDLRDRGVLILGSGNIVHNLRQLRFDGQAHDWAQEFDAYFANQLHERNFTALADVNAMGSLLKMSNPTLEHYSPALTIVGASDERDKMITLAEGIDLGSVSMRSFMFYAR
ncbi:4,5-DOPA dioxygenase extradiol [Vibrio nereis]|uniref:4,5-DOPA-extradiol-dioxygenase n=1 Tax=Vibrio nereis TaxID=693 RepID=UPI00249404DC|nr:4,5-DOPA dioxygenase extradiol [Vibrio nereis]